MTLFIYSYYNDLLDRYESLFTAETDKDIINSVSDFANGTSKESLAFRKTLEHKTLTRLGEINLTSGEIKATSKTALPIKITPPRPIDGIENSQMNLE